MKHPHQALLDEFKIAIEHFVPSIPKELKDEALALHEKLSNDENSEEKEILEQMFAIGMKEYPHRKAFHALMDENIADATIEHVLDHIDESVRAKMEPHLKDGATLAQFVSSEMFETQFSAEERYQVEHGIMDAKDHVGEEMEKSDIASSERYQKLVKKHEEEAGKIMEAISALEPMRDQDEKWKEEIEGRIQTLKGGFLVTEPDTTLEAAENEIEYWRGVLSDGE